MNGDVLEPATVDDAFAEFVASRSNLNANVGNQLLTSSIDDLQRLDLKSWEGQFTVYQVPNAGAEAKLFYEFFHGGAPLLHDCFFHCKLATHMCL